MTTLSRSAVYGAIASAVAGLLYITGLLTFQYGSRVSGDIIPTSTNMYTVGTSTRVWKEGHFRTASSTFNLSKYVSSTAVSVSGRLHLPGVATDCTLGDGSIGACPGGGGSGTVASGTAQGQLLNWRNNAWAPTSTVTIATSSVVTIAKLNGTSSTFTNVQATGNFYGQGYYQTVTKEPTGFPDRTTSVLSFATSTRTFTITPTSGTFKVWSKGKEYSFAATSTVIGSATGTYAIYFDPNMVLKSSTSMPSFIDGSAIVSTVYYANPGVPQAAMSDERHGTVMDGATHEFIHDTIGTRYETGLTGTFTNTSFSITAGSIHDEDITLSVAAVTSTAKLWYKNGTSDLVFDATSSKPYKDSGGVIQYNNTNTLTNATNNYYVAYWVFMANSTAKPIWVLVGQRQDQLLVDARANNTPESLSYANFPSKEAKLLYRVIYRNVGGTATYVEASDYRNVSSVPGGSFTATNHAALTNLAFSASGHSGDLGIVNNIYPTAAGTYSLGSYALNWATAYVSTTRTNTLTAVNTTSTLLSWTTGWGTNLTLTNGSTTNLTATKLWFTNSSSSLLSLTKGWITNLVGTFVSSTAATITTLWGTNATVTNVSSTQMTATRFWSTNATSTFLDIASNVLYNGRKPQKTIVLTAGGSINPTTGGNLGTYQIETTTNKVNYYGTMFSSTTPQWAQWTNIAMPANWDGGTLTARFYFTATSTVGSVASSTWAIRVTALKANDSIDTAWGTAVSTTGMFNKTANSESMTAMSAAITPAGSPSPTTCGTARCGRTLMVRVGHDAANALDTLGLQPVLRHVVLKYTVDRFSEE